MSIFVVGVNHKTAPVDVRERIAFPQEALPGALQSIRSLVNESLILSTCNRTELYISASDEQLPEQLIQWLAQFHNFPLQQLNDHAFVYQQREAVKHALRVACGLDSLVLGEPQILGQLKIALKDATHEKNVGGHINRLMQHAFTTAKKVRTQTDIGANPVSVAFATVNLAKQIFTDLKQQTALLIGAGETIELVSRHLASQKIGNIIIANRNQERAQTLAENFQGEGIGLSDIPEYLRKADIVISSTAAPLPIIGKGTVERALKARRHQPIFMVDIAIPRDIEPEVAELDDIYLYTVDDLHNVIESNKASRETAAAQAEQMVEVEVEKYMSWLQARQKIDMIRIYRQQAEQTRDEVLLKAQKVLQNKGAEQALEFLANTLTNKLLHAPVQTMNQAAHEGNTKLLENASLLFNLKNQDKP